MNITCDQCGKRYKMKAQQTKKAFKTRCKRCSNVIIVRPEEQQNSAQDKVETQEQAISNAQVAATSQASSAIWYAVINGQQSGPFTREQLSSYFNSGGLEAESFVWRDGMANWEALSKIPDLNGLLQQVTPQPVTSADKASVQLEPQALNQRVEGSVRSVQSEVKPDAKANEALSLGVQIGHSRSLLDQVKTEGSRATTGQQHSANRVEEQPIVDGSGQFTDQRNENSVLFSLDSIDGAGVGGLQIHNKAPQRSTENALGDGSPLLTNTGGSEGSGLIDLAALSSLTGNQAGGSSGAPINFSVGMKKGGGRRSLTNRSADMKSIALAISSTALVAILGFMGYQKFIVSPAPISAPITLGNAVKPSSQIVANPIQKSESAELKASQKVATPSNINPINAPQAISESIDKKPKPTTLSKRKSKPKATKRKSRRRSSAKSKRRSSRSKPKVSKSRSRKSPSSSARKSEASSLLNNLKGGRTRNSKSSSLSSITGSGKPKATGPKTPSKSDVKAAMKRVNVSKCLGRDPALKGKGSIKVRVMIISSGAIKSAKVLNSPFKSSPVGACLEREVRRQRVPSFTKSSIKFVYPFST